VMTNLVDEAHGTGMSENQFNTIVRDQFREATQRTTDPTERIRLTAAEQETIRRTRERFTEVASVALNTRRKGLDNLEKAVDNKVTPTRAGRGGRR